MKKQGTIKQATDEVSVVEPGSRQLTLTLAGGADLPTTAFPARAKGWKVRPVNAKAVQILTSKDGQTWLPYLDANGSHEWDGTPVEVTMDLS